MLPPPVKHGDRLRIISPAGPVETERLTAGVELLKSWGYQVETAPHALFRSGFLAGSDNDRLNDLTATLLDPEIDGVICSRGGYGSVRLFDMIDWDVIAATKPKCFVGFSDISAFQLLLHARCGWSSLSGPQAAIGLSGGVTERSLAHLRGMMDGSWRKLSWGKDTETRLQNVSGGGAGGVLLPCNLSMLVSLLGTSYMPNLSGAILCLEDLAEPPYKIDRMLWQLSHSDASKELVAIVIGEFTYENSSVSESACQSAFDHFGSELPIWWGLPYGHIDDLLTFPVGVDVEIDNDGLFKML